MPTFVIPSAPSVNELYYNAPGKGRRKTKRYGTWLRAAGWAMKLEDGRARTWEPISGDVAVEIITGNRRQDNDAGVKAVFDLLTEMKVWNDDRQVKAHSVRQGGNERETIVTVRPLEAA